MAIDLETFSDGNDVLLAWDAQEWSDLWVGFVIERRDQVTGGVTVLANRIPARPGDPPPDRKGIPNDQSPIRRCVWTDHGLTEADLVCYRVRPVIADGTGFTADDAAASRWTEPLFVTEEFGDGLSACFNRGTLMSQVVSRFVKGDVSSASLHAFTSALSQAGNPARRYLSGEARSQMLAFLADADRRGSSIHAAIYEMNDPELVEALKPFGDRGHMLIGNGSATGSHVAEELVAAGLDIHHRDLSHRGASSPSVHNKFVVEVDANNVAARVLTGSTNWTTTGLCTQLNNVLLLSRAVTAARFLDQWHRLVEAGNDLPAELKAANAEPTPDGPVTTYFAATPREEEFGPVLKLIREAKHGALFLMFMPGQSPLLSELLDRSKEAGIYVRGVVSTVAEKGDGIVEVGGQVIKSGADPTGFGNHVLVPANVPAANRPDWAQQEFNAGQIHGAHMMAIVHSKAIVVDPFSDDCAVVTGSHNFSESASERNDENLVIVRGNRALAQAYAVHISGVYDAYAWRSFLDSGGKPDHLYDLSGWRPGGAKRQELNFWMGR